MNLRDGYKITELGEIPVEWEVKDLGDCVISIAGGGTPSRDVQEYYSGNIPWVTVKDMNGTFFMSDAQEHITPDAIKNSASNLIPEGSVIIATRMGLGRGFINTASLAINQDLKALIPKESISSVFLLYFYLSIGEFINSQGSGSTVKGIRLELLRSLSVPVPPLPEQRKIADILSTVDEHISETESLIEKTKVLKQGMMQHLLIKGIGHTEFKDTEIGRIPVEWSVVKFSTLVLFQEGPGLRKWQYTTSGIPFLNIRCIQNNSIDRRSIQFISIEEYESKYKHFSLNSGDLVVSSSGTLGKKAIIKTSDLPLMLNTSIIRMKTLDEKRLSMSFLNYFVESDFYQKAVTQESVGSAQANYGPYHLNKIDIILPPIEEQHRIASILTAIDDQINSYQTKLTTLTKLKSALMQQLLTGKTRVKV